MFLLGVTNASAVTFVGVGLGVGDALPDGLADPPLEDVAPDGVALVAPEAAATGPLGVPEPVTADEQAVRHSAKSAAASRTNGCRRTVDGRLFVINGRRSVTGTPSPYVG
jgi:hypothetical protein